MGKASRNKRQRNEPFEHEPKRPTTPYRTAKEKQEQRRKDRRAAIRQEKLVQQVAASVARGDR